jgi:CheY-like chemotaxis protein
MLGGKATSEKQAQEKKETISKYLRQADEFVRYGRFDEALTQIDFVMMIDAKNFLARSFKERIIFMQKQNAQDTGEQEKPKGMTEDQRHAIIAQLLVSADEMIRNKDYKRALNKISEVYKIEPQNFYAKAYSDRIEQLQQQQQSQAATFFNQQPSAPPGQPAAFQQTAQKIHGAFFMYRELMKEVWFDGKLSIEEEHQLKKVRDLFNITNKEHFEIEREVKVEAYLEGLRIAWKDGVLSQTEKQVLEVMRKRYDITPEEHHAAELKIQEAKKGSLTKATILIVDSEKEHRAGLAGFFSHKNYEVIGVGSIEDSFKLLVNKFPHIVLTEILFTAAQEDGFSLFKKLKAHPTLQNVPFFFMSRLHDEFIVRAGYRLGLDLFFPKPVDKELLLAAIEGRLRTA